MDNKEYVKGVVRYQLNNCSGAFSHNLERDLHLFILWEHGRGHENLVRDYISAKFLLLAEYHILWSKDKVNENFLRLYKAIDGGVISKKSRQVGEGEFICFVVEDQSPEYRYRQNVSGTIELVNTKVLHCKRSLREISGGYYIHSSSGPEEFYEQMALLLGPSELRQVHDVSDGQCLRRDICSDLSGAQGWNDFSEMFDVLRYCSQYVILRNFEFLPDKFFENDKDVDMLCDSVSDTLAAINGRAVKSRKGVCKSVVSVSGISVPFDIRFLGDNYYDMRWQKHILSSRELTEKAVFAPRQDDYFFSLLYHAALQKRTMKDIYKERLTGLARMLQFDFLHPDTFTDERKIAAVLEGFLKASGYVYVAPVDSGVFCNYRILRHIDSSVGGKDKKVIEKLVAILVPRKIVMLFPKDLRAWVKSVLK